MDKNLDENLDKERISLLPTKTIDEINCFNLSF